MARLPAAVMVGRVGVVGVLRSLMACHNPASSAPSVDGSAPTAVSAPTAMAPAASRATAASRQPDADASLARAPAAAAVALSPGACRVVGAPRSITSPPAVAAPSNERVPIGEPAEAHTVSGWVEERATTEGPQRQAFVKLDAGPGVRLSEAGSGATFLELAPRGRDVVAAMLDARRGMTPLHVRVLSLREGRLEVGNDAVLFVGGAPERQTRLAVATSPSGAAVVVLPMPKDALAFGLAMVRVDDPPKDDAPAAWSIYPNGLDPSPVAATHTEQSLYVARVRPAGAEPGSEQCVELGRVVPGTGDVGPSFAPMGIFARAPRVTSVTLAGDGHGVLFMTYRAGTATDGGTSTSTGTATGTGAGAGSGAQTVALGLQCPP